MQFRSVWFRCKQFKQAYFSPLGHRWLVWRKRSEIWLSHVKSIIIIVKNKNKKETDWEKQRHVNQRNFGCAFVVWLFSPCKKFLETFLWTAQVSFLKKRCGEHQNKINRLWILSALKERIGKHMIKYKLSLRLKVRNMAIFTCNIESCVA